MTRLARIRGRGDGPFRFRLHERTGSGRRATIYRCLSILSATAEDFLSVRIVQTREVEVLTTKIMEEAALTAKLFRGFSEPTRLAILAELASGERRVTDLVTVIGSSQANVSGHLACLKDCGLVLDRPQGRQVFYRIATPAVMDVLRSAELLLAVHGHEIELCPNYRIADAEEPEG